MKPFMLALCAVLLLTFWSCKNETAAVGEDAAEDATAVSITPADLVGKTIEYRYGEDIYHVTLDTDSTMHWEAMAGAEKGIKENETYFMEAIDENRIFINWDEANGIAVAQVLDFEKGIVYNHLMINRALRNDRGEISVVQK